MRTRADFEYTVAMLLLNSQIEGTPAMSLQSGSELGKIGQPIIDPRDLSIVAYYIAGPRIQTASVLHTDDIREFGPLGFIVDNADKIMALDEDLVRLQEIINFNFSLLDKSVIDDQKKKLGKVTDYTFEFDSFSIQKIHVSQSVLKNFSNSNLIIHRSQIIELTDKEVIVRSATIPVSTGITQVLNPFRSTGNAMNQTSRTKS